MNFEVERSEFSSILHGWTPPHSMEFFGPNKDFEPPEATGDASAPAAYAVWDVEYEGVGRMTFGGTVGVKGAVTLWLWVERDCGDLVMRELIDSFALAMRDATPAEGLNFFEVSPGVPLSDGSFYGRELSIPFLRFEESIESAVAGRFVTQDGDLFETQVGDELWEQG